MAPKRKRNPSINKQTSEPAPPQPSSRDASDESNEDPVLQEVSALKHKQDGMNPPAKRTATARLGRSPVKATEPMSSEADSPLQRDRPSNKATAKIFDGMNLDGPNAESDKIDAANGKIAPMPPGIVDPVGYHTNPPPIGRPVRVYADGVFDLFHLGHMRQLEQAKKAFPNTILTVGVTGDAETHRRKGLTVLSADERAETVRHCRWVDAVIEDCPWIVTAEFLAAHKFDYVAHDDLPYGAAEGDDIYKPIKEKGMFLVTQRTEGVSTTGIITKIVRDYESYIARQLQRGTSRKDLNISWLKKNELDLKASVKELRENIKSNWAATGQELSKELRQFWQLSRPSSPAPGGQFRLPNMSAPGGDPLHSSSTTSLDTLNTKSPEQQPVRATAHLSHLDVGRSPTDGRPGSAARASDFATGYSLGLMGGVRSWMTRNRRNVWPLSRPTSPDGDHGSDENENENDGDGDGVSLRGRSSRGRGRGAPARGHLDEEEDEVEEEEEEED